jgi:hypothetical protein
VEVTICQCSGAGNTEVATGFMPHFCMVINCVSEPYNPQQVVCVCGLVTYNRLVPLLDRFCFVKFGRLHLAL